MSDEFFSRFMNEPSLVAPHMRETVESSLRMFSQEFQSVKKELSARDEKASDDFWFAPDDWRAVYRPYVVKDGILSIPIRGVLIHDFAYQFGNWATGYTYIAKAVERGLADGEVKGIALIVNSPGGDVAGCFDVADKIYQARKVKPIKAYLSEMAYSAGYALASAASSISIPRTGGLGSVGVVTYHVDLSKAAEKSGYAVTYIFAGKHKVDGHPYAPLPEDVRQRIQERLDTLYSVFVASVARNRGLSEQAVRETEALTFTADKALSVGFADSIGTAGDGLASFVADLNQKQGGTEMSKEQDKPAVDQKEVEAARTQGITEGKAEGAKAERERIAAVMALPESGNRQKSALQIALTTDLSVDQAKALLETIPEQGSAPAQETKAKEKSPFEKAMEQGNPDIGAGAGDPTADVNPVNKILSSYNGPKRKKA